MAQSVLCSLVIWFPYLCPSLYDLCHVLMGPDLTLSIVAAHDYS